MNIVKSIQSIQAQSNAAWETAVDTAGPEYQGGSSEKQNAMQSLADDCGACYDVAIASLEAEERDFNAALESLRQARSLESEGGDCSHADKAIEAIEAVKERETTMNDHSSVSATVIFDNGGGVTVQLVSGDTKWAHYYAGSDEELRSAAGDIDAALLGTDITAYDGDEQEAHECTPSADEILNGGYRVYRFGSVDEYYDFCRCDHSDNWRNIRSLTGWAARGEL